MNRATFIAACALSFVLGSLLPLRNTYAQNNSTSPAHTYYQIAFMKSRPGQDPFKMERDLWKPVHADRVDSGVITGWTVMRPMFSGPHEYDYITVESSNDPNAWAETPANQARYMQFFEKHWGKDKLQSVMTQTEAARDQLGNEIWVSVDSVSKQSK